MGYLADRVLYGRRTAELRQTVRNGGKWSVCRHPGCRTPTWMPSNKSYVNVTCPNGHRGKAG